MNSKCRRDFRLPENIGSDEIETSNPIRESSFRLLRATISLGSSCSLLACGRRRILRFFNFPMEGGIHGALLRGESVAQCAHGGLVRHTLHAQLVCRDLGSLAEPVSPQLSIPQKFFNSIFLETLHRHVPQARAIRSLRPSPSQILRTRLGTRLPPWSIRWPSRTRELI